MVLYCVILLLLCFLLDDVALLVYKVVLLVHYHFGATVYKVAGAVVLAGEYCLAFLVDISILAIALDDGYTIAEG